VRAKFYDSNGDPLALGKVYTYAAGGSTPLVTYQNQSESSQNTNPVILDANGEADIWLGSSAYKFVIKTAADVTVKTVDAISHLSNGQITLSMLEAGILTADVPGRAKMADGFVNEAKLAGNSVSAEKLQDNAVTEGKIANNAVTEDKISDGAVTLEKLADNATFAFVQSFYMNWTSHSAAEANTWTAVGGNSLTAGILIAVSSDGTNRVMKSVTAGESWTAVAAAEANSWAAIVYASSVGRWVAVSTDGTNRVQWATANGSSWNAAAAAEANPWCAITTDGTTYVAVASSGTNRVMTSTNASSWTARSAAEANPWSSIAYGGGVFVAVATTGTNRVMRSTDSGTSWSAVAASEASAWASVAYGNGVFVASAGTGTNLIMRSTDGGVTWSSVAQTTNVGSVVYGNGVFIGNDGASLWVSGDLGLTWSNFPAPNVGSISSVCFGAGRFVGVCLGGTSRVARSMNAQGVV
jgi:hypothetical protein